MKILPGILFLLLSLITHAQTLERQVIASAGTSVSSTIQLDYTVGEIAIQPITSGSILLTQGFHQPFGIIQGNNIFPYLIIFPNPTPGNAQARFILTAPAKMTISIYNSIGQLMGSEEINYTTGEMQYIINSKRLTPGVYIIQFAMNDGSGRISKQLIKME
jgi:hypothetical protein